MVDMLSPYIWVGPSMGTPIILSFYLNPHETSMACFIATNSAPKTTLSTVACLFVYQMIQAILMKKQNPMQDLHLTLSFASSETTKALEMIGFPLGSGTLSPIESNLLGRKFSCQFQGRMGPVPS